MSRLASRPTWIEVSQSALANNVAQIRRQIGPSVLLTAVVKANAYGHGAGISCHTLLEAGADRLAVATLDEAIELRTSGIRAPVLVLGYTPTWLAAEMVGRELTTTVYDLETAQALNQAAQLQARRSQVHLAKVHLKVNTGMNRLGVRPEAAVGVLRELVKLPGIEVEGIFTHFATSDSDRAFACVQFGRFQQLLAELAAEELRPPIAHAANSAAALYMPETHLEMVRCGIALYGLHPDVDGARLPSGFRPALSWKARIAQVDRLQPGESVSYGQEYVATAPVVSAVIPVGYADGFPRRPHTWGSVLVHGQPAPILGRVCMDQTVVDVTAIVEQGEFVQQGDEAVLIGAQRNAVVTAEEVGERLGTINYDVVSRILGRVPRQLVE
jgi:alanine racemase